MGAKVLRDCCLAFANVYFILFFVGKKSYAMCK